MAKSTKPISTKPISTQHVGVAAEIIPAQVVEKARALLTAAEKKFFDSSFGASLAKHTHAQVQAAVKQARILRNKWRDLHQSQSRSAKRSGRVTEAANARTRDKHDILAGVVERFEKRLGELQAAVTAAAKPPVKAAAMKKAVKPAAKVKTKVKPSAKSAAARSKKASRRVTAGLPTTPAVELVLFDRAKQRTATTAAKASRITRSGQGTQRLGHMAASGRRAQRRRDIRSRG